MAKSALTPLTEPNNPDFLKAWLNENKDKYALISNDYELTKVSKRARASASSYLPYLKADYDVYTGVRDFYSHYEKTQSVYRNKAIEILLQRNAGISNHAEFQKELEAQPTHLLLRAVNSLDPVNTGEDITQSLGYKIGKFATQTRENATMAERLIARANQAMLDIPAGLVAIAETPGSMAGKKRSNLLLGLTQAREEQKASEPAPTSIEGILGITAEMLPVTLSAIYAGNTAYTSAMLAGQSATAATLAAGRAGFGISSKLIFARSYADYFERAIQHSGGKLSWGDVANAMLNSGAEAVSEGLGDALQTGAYIHLLNKSGKKVAAKAIGNIVKRNYLKIGAVVVGNSAIEGFEEVAVVPMNYTIDYLTNYRNNFDRMFNDMAESFILGGAAAIPLSVIGAGGNVYQTYKLGRIQSKINAWSSTLESEIKQSDINKQAKIELSQRIVKAVNLAKTGNYQESANILGTVLQETDSITNAQSRISAQVKQGAAIKGEQAVKFNADKDFQQMGLYSAYLLDTVNMFTDQQIDETARETPSAESEASAQIDLIDMLKPETISAIVPKTPEAPVQENKPKPKPKPVPITQAQRNMIKKIQQEKGVSDEDYRSIISQVTDGAKTSSTALTIDEASKVIDKLSELMARPKPVPEVKAVKPAERVEKPKPEKKAAERVSVEKIESPSKKEQVKTSLSEIENKYGFTGKKALKMGIITANTVTSKYGKERVISYSASNLGQSEFNTMMEAIDAYYAEKSRADAKLAQTKLGTDNGTAVFIDFNKESRGDNYVTVYYPNGKIESYSKPKWEIVMWDIGNTIKIGQTADMKDVGIYNAEDIDKHGYNLPSRYKKVGSVYVDTDKHSLETFSAPAPQQEVKKAEKEAAANGKTSAEQEREKAERIAKIESQPRPRQAFEAAYKAANSNLSPEQIDAQLQVYNAMFETVAKAMDVPVDQIYQRMSVTGGGFDNIHVALTPTQIKSAVGNVGTFDPDNPDIRYQDIKAYVKTFADGTFTLGFLKPDITSGLHELFHIGRVFLQDMAKTDPKWGKMLKDAEDWAGVKDGVWTEEADEKFALGGEKYIYTEEAPNSKLKAIFQKIKEWISDLLDRLPLLKNIKLSPEIINVYSALFGKTIHNNLTASQKKAAVNIVSDAKKQTELKTNNAKVIDNAMQQIPDSFTALILKRPRAGVYSFVNIDTDTEVLEVIRTEDGLLVNDAIYHDPVEGIKEALGILKRCNLVNIKNELSGIRYQRGTKEVKTVNKEWDVAIRHDRDALRSSFNSIQVDVNPLRNAMCKYIMRYLSYTHNLPYPSVDMLNSTDKQLAWKEKMQADIERVGGFQNLQDMPLLEMMKVLKRLQPVFYDRLMNEPYRKFVFEEMPKQKPAGVDSDTWIQQILDATLNGVFEGKKASGVIEVWKQQSRRIYQTYGAKAWRNLITHASEATLKHNEILNSGLGFVNQMKKIAYTSSNARKKAYLDDEIELIGSFVLDGIEHERTNARIADAIVAANGEIHKIDATAFAKTLKELYKYYETVIEQFNAKHPLAKIGIIEGGKYATRAYKYSSDLTEPEIDIMGKDVFDLFKPRSTMTRTAKDPVNIPRELHLIKLAEGYVYPMSKYIAYYDFARYIKGNYAKDVPQHMRKLSMTDYHTNALTAWGRSVIGESTSVGDWTRILRTMRVNVTSSFLALKPVQVVQNYFQRGAMSALVSPEAFADAMKYTNQATGMPRHAKVGRNTPLDTLISTLLTEHENLYDSINREARDQGDRELRAIRRKALELFIKTGNISAWVLAKSPFIWAERGNWGTAYMGGALEVIYKTDAYKKARAAGNSKLQASNLALLNPRIFQRAKLAAQVVNAEINADPSTVFAPQIFRPNLLGEMLWFGRFFVALTNLEINTYFGGNANRIYLENLFRENDQDAAMLQAVQFVHDRLSRDSINKMFANRKEINGMTRSDLLRIRSKTENILNSLKKHMGLKPADKYKNIAGLAAYSISMAMVVMIIKMLIARMHRATRPVVLPDNVARAKQVREEKQIVTNAAQELLVASRLPKRGVGLLQGIQVGDAFGNITVKSASRVAVNQAPGLNLFNQAVKDIMGADLIDIIDYNARDEK